MKRAIKNATGKLDVLRTRRSSSSMIALNSASETPSVRYTLVETHNTCELTITNRDRKECASGIGPSRPYTVRRHAGVCPLITVFVSLQRKKTYHTHVLYIFYYFAVGCLHADTGDIFCRIFVDTSNDRCERRSRFRTRRGMGDVCTW
jgi:hypothetical protein